MNNKGFTLLELLITMGLFVGIVIISSSAFNSILRSSSSLAMSEESNIEGIVGLEMFRHDLQQTGFGLPYSYSVPISYSEATVAPASALNDASAGVPRAIVSINDIGSAADTGSETGNTYNLLSGTDYLAIKASTVGRNKASQKWTYLTYSSNGGKKPNSWPNTSDNFASDDRAIVINRGYTKEGLVTASLISPTATPNIYWINNATTILNSEFIPTAASQVHYIYGIRTNNGSGDLGMPFNRTDFFVARPSNSMKIPQACAPSTGILYKANVNHDGGALVYMPLVDCVADMQVVYGWEEPVGSGVITESNADGTSTIGSASNTSVVAWLADPSEIRNRLKYIKVYIMAQDGRKDTNYKNENTLVSNQYAIVVGDPATNVSITRTYTKDQLAGNGWLNYRWKTYRIIVRPKNLTN